MMASQHLEYGITGVGVSPQDWLSLRRSLVKKLPMTLGATTTMSGFTTYTKLSTYKVGARTLNTRSFLIQTQNETIDLVVSHFTEIGEKMRKMDSAGRFTAITSILDWYVRLAVSGEAVPANRLTVQAHLLPIITNSLPEEVITADDFGKSTTSAIENILAKQGAEYVKTEAGAEGTFVSKRLAQAVLERILIMRSIPTQIDLESLFCMNLSEYYSRFAL